MQVVESNRPVKVLKEHIKKLAEEDAVLKIQLSDRDAYIEEMEAKLRNLLGDLFAPSSERIHLATKDGVTVEYPQDESDPLDPPMSGGKKKRGAQIGHRGNGRKIPDSIPPIEVIHEISEDQKICSECGLSYRDLTLTEDSVEIDYEVKVILKKHRRRKAAKTCDCAVPTIITAPKPPQIIPKGMFSTSFLSLAIVQKYFFQIPLNRQIAQWAMNGLEVNAGTLIGCFEAIMAFLTPLYNLLVEVSRSQKHWHVDETRWLMFVEKPGKIGYRWWLSAWTVRPRDNFIGWTKEQRISRLHLVVNNSRFLILPWVHVKNLASKVLSQCTKQLPNDWNISYGYTPVLLETFVEKDRFTGTCYKAANWCHVGQTQGRGKIEQKKGCKLPIKDIYLYPLSKKFREILTRTD